MGDARTAGLELHPGESDFTVSHRSVGQRVTFRRSRKVRRGGGLATTELFFNLLNVGNFLNLKVSTWPMV